MRTQLDTMLHADRVIDRGDLTRCNHHCGS